MHVYYNIFALSINDILQKNKPQSMDFAADLYSLIIHYSYLL